MSYDWSGFTVDIPPGAIPDDGVPVTMNIQASLNGKFQFPDDRVLVSGVYRISLHPPVKFAQKVTVRIQHCGCDDSALSFVTTKHTQKSLPYTFEYLSGGSFSESSFGTIKIDHFCEVGIVGKEKSKYAIHTYYIPKGLNIYVAHITVTTLLELAIQVCNIILHTQWLSFTQLFLQHMSKDYADIRAEKGPYITGLKFEASEVSLKIPHETMRVEGWELYPSVLPTVSVSYVCIDEVKAPFYIHVCTS